MATGLPAEGTGVVWWAPIAGPSDATRFSVSHSERGI